jgi:hypothetical protein
MKQSPLLLRLGLGAGALAMVTCQALAALYNPTTGHYYEIVSSDVNGAWANAEAVAVANGGNLVTLNDAAEEAWVRQMFGETTRFWIGFNDASVEGDWVWSSGEPITYVNWEGGEPNNSTPPDYGEDFAVLNWRTDTGAWNDWDHMRGDYYHIDGIAEYTRSIPDPGSTFVLMGLGCLALGAYRARRQ